MSSHPVRPPPRWFALVPCAGVGARAGTAGPKQYQPLAGQAVVAHALAALAALPEVTATLVVLAPGDTQFAAAAPAHTGERAWVADCGGVTRAASVAAGLEALLAHGAQPHDWVLVHDAARCLIEPVAVQRLIAACAGDEVGGLLALPLADTLKRADADADTCAGGDRVRATLPRAHTWLAQTPQAFRIGLLARALAQAGDGVTDESSAIEALGLQPRLVPGDADNFKLTWPADFARAERVLMARRMQRTDP